MTPERTKEAIAWCASAAEKHFGKGSGLFSLEIEHVMRMAPKAEALVNEGRIEKAMRWLGFMQGALWALGIVTIEECKRANAPVAPEPWPASTVFSLAIELLGEQRVNALRAAGKMVQNAARELKKTEEAFTAAKRAAEEADSEYELIAYEIANVIAEGK